MYKNPPIEHRFKKGQSGNPKGRPKSEDIEIVELMVEFAKLLMQSHAKNKNAKEKVKKIKEVIRG